MDKLVVVIMGQNCQKFIGMCLESVKSADAIVYCDGGSTDETLQTVSLKSTMYDMFSKEEPFQDRKEGINDKKLKEQWNTKLDIIENPYDQEDKQMNGKQRNFYLDYIKKNYPNDWCLCLDADEVCEDISKIKEFIQTAEPGLYSPKMRHFIGDLGHEDATRKDHWVPNRLFKISEAESYQEDSHPVLNGKMIGGTTCTTIFHLGHLPVEYMKYISKRYKEHAGNSTIHSQKFLRDWRDAHLYGTYPTRQINPIDIPKVILNNFGIDFDELYFTNRGLEAKHFIDASHWKEFFKCKNAIELGCGLGPRVYAMNTVGIDAAGIELSKYAVSKKMHSHIIQGDILDNPKIGNYDLSIAYDILEHLNYKDLSKAIENLIHYSKKYILVSIPYKGMPTCDADPTHIIKESREWWVKQFLDKGLKEVEVPEHFLYKRQLLIFKKGGKKE